MVVFVDRCGGIGGGGGGGGGDGGIGGGGIGGSGGCGGGGGSDGGIVGGGIGGSGGCGGGGAGQIHVSHETYMGLLEWGGYSFVKRGKIDIRGKGTMYTYWLTGRDDFDILGLDVSARDHMGIHEHRYAHMYDQMYKGRVQFAGKNLSESPTNL
ncbi:glycine-rich cell wall structural protein 1.0-like [Strongylocentrotus purpuratus]|uniref:Guanylate cyclase domain-containing protein n=1 Tax=Strongylocentrotus purpuratus TaxID=7668 RepID=A0A7M7NLM1_STRPU|nr:glycine-rich cell wall structural protein 1.0-like [Strongylocentrotus purpuratus]